MSYEKDPHAPYSYQQYDGTLTSAIALTAFVGVEDEEGTDDYPSLYYYVNPHDHRKVDRLMVTDELYGPRKCSPGQWVCKDRFGNCTVVDHPP